MAEIGEALEPPQGAEVVDAGALHAFPAFVDPHVHLRTPGREDEEDIDSGSRAAAAGGDRAILAQPNTSPVVDSAPVLRSLRERAGAGAHPDRLPGADHRQRPRQLFEIQDVVAGEDALAVERDVLVRGWHWCRPPGSPTRR